VPHARIKNTDSPLIAIPMDLGKQAIRHLKQYSKHYEITKEAMKKPQATQRIEYKEDNSKAKVIS
jgi:hypothetical protein